MTDQALLEYARTRAVEAAERLHSARTMLDLVREGGELLDGIRADVLGAERGAATAAQALDAAIRHAPSPGEAHLRGDASLREVLGECFAASIRADADSTGGPR